MLFQKNKYFSIIDFWRVLSHLRLFLNHKKNTRSTVNVSSTKVALLFEEMTSIPYSEVMLFSPSVILKHFPK